MVKKDIFLRQFLANGNALSTDGENGSQSIQHLQYAQYSLFHDM